MALSQKKYLTCAVCGRTSPPAELKPEVQVLAREEGWLVSKRGHNATDQIRTRGNDDYCPDHRGAHEIIFCEGPPRGLDYREVDGVRLCPHQAILRLIRTGDEKTVHTCAFHVWVLEKEMLFIGDENVEIRSRVIEP